MIKFSSENKNALTPGFVSTALEGITHRFLLVLECETRMYGEGQQQPSKHVIVPPRFAIGGPRATIDPRVAKVEELMPLAKYKLQLPDGWEKVHQYIYVLQPTTDEHGWQYRSEWSNGPLTDKDEQWVRSNAPGLDVRRRLWMATVVSRDLVVTAKRRLAEAIASRVRGIIMEGTLFRQEQGALMKTWQKRHVVLTDDTIEVYTAPKEDGGRRTAELSIVDCEAKMLFGVQCPGRDFAFSIRKNPKNTLVALFDSENREVRRRWVVAIRYQLALLSPEVNFPPFDYGPPTGDEAATRVLMCGELQKQGHMVRNWKHRFFQLMPYEIQYFERETLKGNFMITGAVLTTDEKSLDFSLRSPTGKILVMRADNPNNKATWVRALARQIAILDEKKDEIENENATEGQLAPETPAAPATAAEQAKAEEAAKEAEKAENAAADLEWETNTAPAPSSEASENVVVVAAALENVDIAKDDSPVVTAAVTAEEEAAAPALTPVAAPAPAPVQTSEPEVVSEPVAVVANPAPATEDNAATDKYYPYEDGKNMHESAQVSDFEAQQQPVQEALPASTPAGAPEPAAEPEAKPAVRTEEVFVEVSQTQPEPEEEREEPAAVSPSKDAPSQEQDNDEDRIESRAPTFSPRSSEAPSSSPKAERPSTLERPSEANTSQRLKVLADKATKRASTVTSEIYKWESKLDEKGTGYKVPTPLKK